MSDQTADTPSGSNENYQQRLLEKNVDLKRGLSLAGSHGSIAWKHLEKFQSSLKKGESALSNSVAELANALKGLEEDPADLEKRAKSVKTDEELDSLIGREREREKILNDAMDKFTGNVEEVVQKLKLRSTASRQFDELRNSFKEKHRSRLADINFDLKSAVVGLDKPLNEMQQRAMQQWDSVDWEAQVSLVKQFEEEFDEIMGNFIKQGEESVRQIKDIGKRMAEATSRLQIDGEGKENGKGEKKNEKENVCGQREESVEQATSVKVTDHPGQVLGDSDCPYPPLSYQTLEAWFLHNVENGLAHMKQGNASRGAVPLANAIALNLADGMAEKWFKGILEPDQFRAVLAELPAARKRIPRFSAERNQKENTTGKK